MRALCGGLRVKRLAVGQGRINIPCRRRACVCVQGVCVCVSVGWEERRWEREMRRGWVTYGWERWRKEAHIKLPSKTIAPS